MIKLAFAIGYLSVFGLLGFALFTYLKRFATKETETKQETKKETK